MTPTPPPAPPRHPLLLVVDDSLQHRVLAEGFLASAGYRVELAESGAEALARVAAAPPDLVVLDVRMPGMSGAEVCRAIRALPGGRDLPVLFVTTLQDPEVQRAAYDAGADDCLTKPLTPTELLMRVRSLLRIRRLSLDLRRRSAVIEQHRDTLLESLRVRRQLFHMVLHDLKNPLSSSRSELRALRALPGMPEAALEVLTDLDEGAQWMERMVHQILSLAGAEHHPLEVAPEWVQAAAALEQAIAPARRQLAELERGISVSVSAGAEELFVDADLLRRALANLVDNAGRHAPRGTDVRVEVTRQQACWEIAVIDDGPGVPEEQRGVIFDAFTSLGEAGARTGRGLGLAFCRLVAEGHGGRIGVHPGPEGGSRFWMRLPLPPGGGDAGEEAR